MYNFVQLVCVRMEKPKTNTVTLFSGWICRTSVVIETISSYLLSPGALALGTASVHARNDYGSFALPRELNSDQPVRLIRDNRNNQVE